MQFLYNNFQVVNEKHYVKKYKDFSEIVICKSVLDKGYEPLSQKTTSNKEKNRISISRIKSKVRDFALMNDFDYFFTQTMNSNYDRFNLNEFKNIILKKFKAYKRINRNFIYLIIFEKHKNRCFSFTWTCRWGRY